MAQNDYEKHRRGRAAAKGVQGGGAARHPQRGAGAGRPEQEQGAANEPPKIEARMGAPSPTKTTENETPATRPCAGREGGQQPEG